MGLRSWLSSIVRGSVYEAIQDRGERDYVRALESKIHDQEKRIVQLEDAVTRSIDHSAPLLKVNLPADVTPISKMKFDTKMQRGRILNALNRAGIKTMEQLCNCTKKRLLSIYWFDYQSWKRCVTAAKELGYTMRESEE